MALAPGAGVVGFLDHQEIRPSELAFGVLRARVAARRGGPRKQRRLPCAPGKGRPTTASRGHAMVIPPAFRRVLRQVPTPQAETPSGSSIRQRPARISIAVAPHFKDLAFRDEDLIGLHRSPRPSIRGALPAHGSRVPYDP